MSPGELPDRGFEPELTPAEEALGDSLAADRPVPSAAFRGGLARLLQAQDAGHSSRPADLWRTVGMLLAAGVVLLLIGLLIAV